MVSSESRARDNDDLLSESRLVLFLGSDLLRDSRLVSLTVFGRLFANDSRLESRNLVSDDFVLSLLSRLESLVGFVRDLRDVFRDSRLSLLTGGLGAVGLDPGRGILLGGRRRGEGLTSRV